MQAFIDNLLVNGTNIVFKLVGVVLIWIVGTWLIGLVVSMISKAINRNKNVDVTMSKYIASAIAVLMKVVLVVSMLGYLGVETTSFAALLAAVGFAIGTAWGGLLANLAAGVFLVFLRPFKVSDYVSIGGLEGTVNEISLFNTAIDTPDNIRTYVGNNKILADNIQNFTANAYRRVDLVAQLSHGTDHKAAIGMLKERLANIPNVIAAPAPLVEILTFTLAGPVLAVRPFCNNAHYWQVYFDTNRLIRESFGEAKFPVPEQHLAVRNPA